MDELSLTRAEKGRRLNCIDAEKSLLLLKPTMSVSHRGGLQLRTDDYAYDILRQWIAEGGGVDAAKDHGCTLLERYLHAVWHRILSSNKDAPRLTTALCDVTG